MLNSAIAEIGINEVELKKWTREMLDTGASIQSICESMIASGYKGSYALEFVAGVSAEYMDAGWSEPGVGLCEWVLFQRNSGRSNEDIEQIMVESGYSRRMSKSYIKDVFARKIRGSTDDLTGPRLFSTDVDLAVCKKLWNRYYELDKVNRVELGDRTARITMKRPNSGIFLIDGFLSESECNHLVSINRGRTEPSMVVDAKTGGNIQDPVRTSKGSSHKTAEDDVIKCIEVRLSKLIGLDEGHQESLQILEYEVGKEYKPHHDYFESTQEGHRKLTSEGGQRIATVLFYLEDSCDGGETYFPQLGLAIAPKKGSALLFTSCDENGLLIFWSQHGGAPVIDGEKWVGTKWIRSGTGRF